VDDMALFSKAVRSHWGIENSLHWCLDVVFNEDKSRTHVDNSGENFAVTRHLALNLLKAYPAKMSFARKRRKCEYDADFVANVHISQNPSRRPDFSNRRVLIEDDQPPIDTREQ